MNEFQRLSEEKKDSLYRTIQNLITEGLVVIIGSGYSCGYGLPGMKHLADALLKRVPESIATMSEQVQCDAKEAWNIVESKLKEACDLETALQAANIGEDLYRAISEIVAQEIVAKESKAIEEILGGGSATPLSKLMERTILVADRFDVVTTNYDRLIEAHAAFQGYPVDTMFTGDVIGTFDPSGRTKELQSISRTYGKRNQLRSETVPHVRLSKPHGSLDWRTFGNRVYRTSENIEGDRRIIAPGGNKYRAGYENPFEEHRFRANEAISDAKAMIFIGYGFNDDHLEVKMKQKIKEVDSLVLTRTLTKNARRLIGSNARMIGVEKSEEEGCSVVHARNATGIVESSIWELDILMNEVLQA